MRVIAGIARGHRLFAPSSKRVRPALDKIKGAIFNILSGVEGARVLDLFAGSGSIGIEALSRGASFAVFVEEFGPAVGTIVRNLEKCGFSDRADILRMTVAKAVSRLARRGERFDLVFIDPPYLEGLVNPTLKGIARTKLIGADSTIVVEHHPREQILETGSLVLTDTRKYGQTLVSFLAARR